MATEVRLNELIAQLNDQLGDVTPYKLAVVSPRDVRHVEKNAHYMPAQTYRKLVGNIKQDGNLSSLPFCWRDADGRFVALSGNHRVDAARDAGIESILVLFTDRALSQPERVAIQLSHNAVVGEDNPAVLRELWQQVDTVALKIYSGLDEKVLQALDPANVLRPKEAALRFEELSILFLPHEREHMDEIARLLTDRAKKARVHHWLAPVEVFDRFFDALLTFKESANIVNTGTAMLAIIDIVEAWLVEHHEAEHAEAVE